MGIASHWNRKLQLLYPAAAWMRTRTNPFSTFFGMMLQQATEDIDDEDGVYVRYRTDGSLFNLRPLQAYRKTLEQLFRELLFVAAAIVVRTETALQHITSCFAEAAQLFGLKVSLKKTEILHQPSPSQDAHHPLRITSGQPKLKTVHQFSNLGCAIFSDAKLDKEIDKWLARTSTRPGRLH